MDHSDQHIEAQKKTMAVKSEISVSLFYDKVREMGTLTVEKRRIVIELNYLPNLIIGEFVAEFLGDEVKLAIVNCYKKYPEAFRA